MCMRKSNKNLTFMSLAVALVMSGKALTFFRSGIMLLHQWLKYCYNVYS